MLLAVRPSIIERENTWNVGYFEIPALLLRLEGPDLPSLNSTSKPSAIENIQVSTRERARRLYLGSRNTHVRHHEAYLRSYTE